MCLLLLQKTQHLENIKIKESETGLLKCKTGFGGVFYI